MRPPPPPIRRQPAPAANGLPARALMFYLCSLFGGASSRQDGMTDFSKPYGDVAYFGIWASETATDYGTRDAVAILTAAVKRCRDEDMREDRETLDAIAYLTAQGHDKRAAQFRKALDLSDPMERRQATAKAVNAIITVLAHSAERATNRF
jgi:hypothetical protein